MTKTAGRVKAFVRFAALAAVSTAILALLRLLGILNLRLFGEAFARGNGAIWLVASSLFAMTAVALVRYWLILRLVSFKARAPQVVAAGLISQAVGQWAPGSMAVTELIRFGLMAGLGEDADSAPEAGLPGNGNGTKRAPGLSGSDGAAGAKGRLGLSILIDRLLGLGTMFLVGGLAGFYLHLRGGMLVKYPLLVFSLAVLSVAFGLGLILAPLLTKTSPWRKLARFLAIKAKGRAFDSTFARDLYPQAITAEEDPQAEPGAPAAAARPPVANNSAQIKSRSGRIWGGLSDAIELLNGAAARPRRLLIPIALSLVIPFLNGATLFYAAQAIGRPLPLAVILVAVPFTILAVLLPLGLAGYGGPQLVAAGVFGLFNVSPETVVAACLVQNTVVLAVTTVLGALSAGFTLDRLRAVFAARKNRLPERRSP